MPIKFVHLMIAAALLASSAHATQNGGSSDALEPRLDDHEFEKETQKDEAMMDAMEQKLSDYQHAKNKVTALLQAAAESPKAQDQKPKSRSERRVEDLKNALAEPVEGDDHELSASEKLIRASEASAGADGHAWEPPSKATIAWNLRASGKTSDKEKTDAAGKAPKEVAKIADSAEGESSMEKTLTDMMMAGGDLSATPFGDSVQQIRDLIEKDMMQKVLDAHKLNQEKLYQERRDLEECGTTKDVSVAKADIKKKTYMEKSPLHKTCREGESGKHTEKIDCLNEEKAKKEVMELKCETFDSVEKLLGDQEKNGNIVQVQGGENPETYVRRLTSTICGEHFHKGMGKGGAGKEGFLDKYIIAQEGCHHATVTYNDQVEKCKQLTKEYDEKKAECDSLQDQMDTAACKRAIGMKDACETYAECYHDRHKIFDATEKMVKTEERDRKAEWKGLKRMECLMDAFKDRKVTSREVNNCKKATHSTDHLTIDYPHLPELVACEVPDLYPSTPEYKLAEFAHLPALAKGRDDANQCTGVVPIPTVPGEGSPETCKCERMTLNGPYSPGPLVKCSNCTDVRRSDDKNSCPEGTKLFSPRSSEDWRTVFGSGGEVKDPYFIVDITRPQNGCEICHKKPMNSHFQGTEWVTSDGSAWWLRSTRTTEPSGNYHANCYLGLLKPYENPNTLNFHDDECKFHSKSYYCQLRDQPVKPKRGSPASCKCENVVLTGHYTAGGLVKCTGCLPVARSTQKNSCPLGTKIFSPENVHDWKTFLASARPLRSPHWIVDVTRPQNGCGGCTKFPMNSESPPQMTWRTSDGSPWWLRSTKYTEPTEDYSANCYMDLFEPPASENSVAFRPRKCRIFSNGYYCQPVHKPKAEEEEAKPEDEAAEEEAKADAKLQEKLDKEQEEKALADKKKMEEQAAAAAAAMAGDEGRRRKKAKKDEDEEDEEEEFLQKTKKTK